MHDDFLTPIWAERHGDFAAFVADRWRQTRFAFERLAARTYDAPWRRDATANQCSAPKRLG